MRLQRRLRSLPLQQVRLTDRFWGRYQRLLATTTLEIQYRQCVETGRIEHFRRVARGERGTFKGRYFNDSDVYKWIEAGSFLLAALGSDPEFAAPLEKLRSQLDDTIDAIASAQAPDGYLNTFFQLQHPDMRWRNLGAMHEMYCMGHLLEAAAAHHGATGSRRLLEVGVRVADHVASIFGPDKRKGYCGHEEFELGLLRLADAVRPADSDRAERYVALARWMVDERGSRPSPFEVELQDDEAMKLSPWLRNMLAPGGTYKADYCQDHARVRDAEEVVGHAVRAMYLLTAATEAFEDRGDDEIEAAIERLWNNLTRKRMYLTGGIGPSGHNEGFVGDHHLPNRTAYAETCAAVGLVFWSHKLAQATFDSDHVDVLERALYNGALAGISLEGDRFFYENPLESAGDHHRQDWFDCACCPPNLARLVASLGAYVVGRTDEALAIQIPCACEIETVFGGVPVRVSVESDFPWSGEVRIHVDANSPATFELAVRMPGWCGDVETEFDGVEAEYRDGYMVFAMTWEGRRTLRLDFEMEPRWWVSNLQVIDNCGRTALTRGPLVYCLEEVDLGEPVARFTVDPTSSEVESLDPGLLEGVIPIRVEGWLDRPGGWPDELYTAEEDLPPPAPRRARMIPYYAWDSRGAGSMQVWLRRPM